MAGAGAHDLATTRLERKFGEDNVTPDQSDRHLYQGLLTFVLHKSSGFRFKVADRRDQP